MTGTTNRAVAGARVPRSAGWPLALAGRVPVALALLVLAGVALRVWMSTAQGPAAMNMWDTGVYVGMARDELFADPVRPAGYSIFLRAVHAISSDLDVTVLVQHLLGIATALILYATVRRIGAPVWAAALGAAAVLLSLDQVFLEHVLLSEALFTLGIAVTLYASVRALDDPIPLAGGLSSRHAWILGAGAALGLTTWVRTVGAVFVPVLALWFLIALRGTWRARLLNGALGALAAATMLLAYSGLNASETGHFGLTRSAGWAVYARAAPFADCDRFDPPAGTERLCETTPSGQRPGPDFYAWQPQSPAQRLFGGPPNGSEELSAFGRAAITHQPSDYASAVATETARYFVPSAIHPRPYTGPGYEALDVERRAPNVERYLQRRVFDGYYSGQPLAISGAIEPLGNLQDVLRVHPAILLLTVIAGAIGLGLCDGRVRAGLALLLGTGLLTLVAPVAVGVYTARYAIPADGPLVAAGTIGVWLMARRVSEIRRAASASRARPAPG